MPCFINDDVLEELWDTSKVPSSCLAHLLNGLDTLGIFEPIFRESGSNKHTLEKAVYGRLIKYVREVTSGRREGLSLGSILQFVTGTDEEPVLGFTLQPSLEFCEVRDFFIPTYNTCINRMIIPRPSTSFLLPTEENLFELYDYAFHNCFYGLK